MTAELPISSQAAPGKAAAPPLKDRLWRWAGLAFLLGGAAAALWLFTRPMTPSYQADMWLGRGFWHYQNGRYKQAVEAFDEALAIDPAHAAAYYNRAHAYADLGQYAEALTDYGHVIDLYPGFAEVYAERGQLYWEIGEYPAALADLNTALDLRPYDVRALFWRARTHDSMGDESAARADFEAFLQSYDIDDEQAGYARRYLGE